MRATGQRHTWQGGRAVPILGRFGLLDATPCIIDCTHRNMWHGMNAWHKGGLVQLGPPAAATTGRWTTCSTQQHSASSAYDASAFDAHLVHAPRCGYVWRQGWQRRPASRSGEEALARARGGVRGCHSARHGARHGARWMRRHALEWPFGSERGAQHRAVVRWERRH